MIIRPFPAFNGDFILVKLASGDTTHNIMIDGGTPRNYRKNLSPELDVLRDAGESVDLLVTTHIDDDHIGGIVKYFSDGRADKSIVKKVWFNSGELLKKYFDSGSEPNRTVRLLRNDVTDMSVRQGVSLEAEIKRLSIWDHPVLLSGHKEDLAEMDITLVSPNLEALALLNEKWQTEKSDVVSMSGEQHDDFAFTIKELASREFKQDKSIPNGSSIALSIKAGSKAILMLADAHPSVIVEGLKQIQDDQGNRIKYDFVKVSHHASKGNTSDELLQIIDCNRFMISTDGSKHGLPDKEAIARIIKHFPDCTLYFNYKNAVTTGIFTEKDKQDYPNFKCVYLEDINFCIEI